MLICLIDENKSKVAVEGTIVDIATDITTLCAKVYGMISDESEGAGMLFMNYLKEGLPRYVEKLQGEFMEVEKHQGDENEAFLKEVIDLLKGFES